MISKRSTACCAACQLPKYPMQLSPKLESESRQPNGSRKSLSLCPISENRHTKTAKTSVPFVPSKCLLLLCVICLLLTAVDGFSLDRRRAGLFVRDQLELDLKRKSIPAVTDNNAIHERQALKLFGVDSTLDRPPFIHGQPLKHAARSFVMPRAFDTSLGTNFTTTSCPRFFNSFLNDVNFQRCAPVSLMLQTSASFFDDTKSKTLITRVLDASCAAPYSTCSQIMASVATQLLSSSTCLADYTAQNPIVVEAYAGLVSYNVVYETTCLKDTTSGSRDSFCFAEAITNASAPTSSYIYYLPLGVNLPKSAMPTCNTCLQRTMSAFATAAANGSQPLSLTYASAASSINIVCGPQFAKQNVKIMVGAGGRRSWNGSSLLATISAILFLFFW